MPRSRVPQSYRSTTSLPLSLIPLIYLTAGGLFLYSTLALLPSSLFPFLLSILASQLPTYQLSTAASAALYIPSAPTILRGKRGVGLFYSILYFRTFSAFGTHWPLSLHYPRLCYHASRMNYYYWFYDIKIFLFSFMYCIYTSFFFIFIWETNNMALFISWKQNTGTFPDQTIYFTQ